MAVILAVLDILRDPDGIGDLRPVAQGQSASSRQPLRSVMRPT